MGQRLVLVGQSITRYGAVILLVWSGAMKFLPLEAEGVTPLVALGVIEIAIGLLIAVRPLWPMVSAIGSLLAAGMILTTLTFLFSTSGTEPSLGGFPAIAPVSGQIVLKDVVLLGAALSSAGEALIASGAKASTNARRADTSPSGRSRSSIPKGAQS